MRMRRVIRRENGFLSIMIIVGFFHYFTGKGNGHSQTLTLSSYLLICFLGAHPIFF